MLQRRKEEEQEELAEALSIAIAAYCDHMTKAASSATPNISTTPPPSYAISAEEIKMLKDMILNRRQKTSVPAIVESTPCLASERSACEVKADGIIANNTDQIIPQSSVVISESNPPPPSTFISTPAAHAIFRDTFTIVYREACSSSTMQADIAAHTIEDVIGDANHHTTQRRICCDSAICFKHHHHDGSSAVAGLADTPRPPPPCGEPEVCPLPRSILTTVITFQKGQLRTRGELTSASGDDCDDDDDDGCTSSSQHLNPTVYRFPELEALLSPPPLSSPFAKTSERRYRGGDGSDKKGSTLTVEQFVTTPNIQNDRILFSSSPFFPNRCENVLVCSNACIIGGVRRKEMRRMRNAQNQERMTRHPYLKAFTDDGVGVYVDDDDDDVEDEEAFLRAFVADSLSPHLYLPTDRNHTIGAGGNSHAFFAQGSCSCHENNQYVRPLLNVDNHIGCRNPSSSVFLQADLCGRAAAMGTVGGYEGEDADGMGGGRGGRGRGFASGFTPLKLMAPNKKMFRMLTNEVHRPASTVSSSLIAADIAGAHDGDFSSASSSYFIADRREPLAINANAASKTVIDAILARYFPN